MELWAVDVRRVEVILPKWKALSVGRVHFISKLTEHTLDPELIRLVLIKEAQLAVWQPTCYAGIRLWVEDFVFQAAGETHPANQSEPHTADAILGLIEHFKEKPNFANEALKCVFHACLAHPAAGEAVANWNVEVEPVWAVFADCFEVFNASANTLLNINPDRLEQVKGLAEYTLISASTFASLAGFITFFKVGTMQNYLCIYSLGFRLSGSSLICKGTFEDCWSSRLDLMGQFRIGCSSETFFRRRDRIFCTLFARENKEREYVCI